MNHHNNQCHNRGGDDKYYSPKTCAVQNEMILGTHPITNLLYVTENKKKIDGEDERKTTREVNYCDDYEIDLMQSKQEGQNQEVSLYISESLSTKTSGSNGVSAGQQDSSTSLASSRLNASAIPFTSNGYYRSSFPKEERNQRDDLFFLDDVHNSIKLSYNSAYSSTANSTHATEETDYTSLSTTQVQANDLNDRSCLDLELYYANNKKPLTITDRYGNPLHMEERYQDTVWPIQENDERKRPSITDKYGNPISLPSYSCRQGSDSISERASELEHSGVTPSNIVSSKSIPVITDKWGNVIQLQTKREVVTSKTNIFLKEQPDVNGTTKKVFNVTDKNGNCLYLTSKEKEHRGTIGVSTTKSIAKVPVSIQNKNGHSIVITKKPHANTRKEPTESNPFNKKNMPTITDKNGIPVFFPSRTKPYYSD